MITIDEMHEMLNDLMDELPPAFFNELTGGVSLHPEAKLNPHAVANDLYVLGEYHQDRLGRYIILYYGSFTEVYPRASAERIKEELRKTLRHEFRHHLESLGCDDALEVEDKIQLQKYLRRHYRLRRKKDNG